MIIFWICWGSLIVGILLLACFVELNGARSGFQGANGIFMVMSGVLAAFSLPVGFTVTWMWASLGTALLVSLVVASTYAAIFALALRLLDRSIGSIAAAARKR